MVISLSQEESVLWDQIIYSGNPADFVGRAPQHVDEFVGQVAELVERFPDAGSYQPAPIL